MIRGKTYAHTLFEPLVHPYLAKEMPVKSGLPFSDAPLQIAFLGNLNESNRDAFSFFVNAIADRSDIHLKIISSTPTKPHFPRVPYAETYPRVVI